MTAVVRENEGRMTVATCLACDFSACEPRRALAHTRATGHRVSVDDAHTYEYAPRERVQVAPWSL